MATNNVAITDLDLFNTNILNNAIFKEIIKNDHCKDMNKDVLQQQINMFVT